MKFGTVTCVCLLTCSSAYGDVGDPPSRVVRIRTFDGAVAIQDAGSTAFSPVTHNWPVAPGDRVRTDKTSRAELDIGDATLLLDATSELEVDALEPTMTRLKITTGVAELDVADSIQETINLQLAHASIQISAPGAYRLEVSENGDAWMAVRRGEARINTDHAVFEQRSDEEVAIAHEGTFDIAPAAPKENSDRHADRPPREREESRTAKHVAPALVGSRDLQDYGVWRWIPEYGMVWEPTRVASDWAPYRFGRWIWKSPWGWTWVDDAPWGFAPFHFGRWAYIGTRWIWVPGPRQVQAAYAPALVRWVKAPRDRDLVGWYPLTPHEDYVPPYAASEGYRRNLNLFAVVRSGMTSRALPNSEQTSTAGLTWNSREVFAGHPPPDTAARSRVAISSP
jgi:hypothetical protein